MIAPVALLVFAVFLGYIVAPALAYASWPRRAPGLGILVWLTLGTSALVSLLLAGLSLAVPEIPEATGLANFFHACSDALREHYATPGGATSAFAGAALTVALLSRTALVATRASVGRVRVRRRHRDMIDLVARPHDVSGVVVVDHPEPAAYCVPGRPGRIVISEGSLALLTSTQLDQVLRHESAHLRSRHHWAIAISDTLAATSVGLFGTRAARRAIGDLTEMHADDAVESRFRPDLAEAVLLIAGGAPALGVLNAGGGHVAERVYRLQDADMSITTTSRAALILGVVATLTTPLALAMLPALEAIAQHYCPLV